MEMRSSDGLAVDEQTMTSGLRAAALLKMAALMALTVFLILMAVSGYRAYFQVRSLELSAPAEALRSGASISATVVSYGRTYAEARIELLQGGRVETLATQQVAKNEYALFDPRTQRATLALAVTPETLARFQNGPALLRATARGRPQWLRTPPPVVRELVIEIQRE